MDSKKADFLNYFGIVKKTATRFQRKAQIVCETPSHFSVFDRRVLLSFPLTSSGAKHLKIYERPEIRLTPSATVDTVRQYETYCCTPPRGKSKKNKLKKKNKLIAEYLKNVRKRLRVLYNPPKKKLGPTNRILNLNFHRYSPFFRYSFTKRERRERSRQLEFGLTQPARSLLRKIRTCQVCVRRMNPDVCRAYKDLCRVRLKPLFPLTANPSVPNSFKPCVTLCRLPQNQLPPMPKPGRRANLRSSRVPVRDYVDLDDEADPGPEFVVRKPTVSLRRFPLTHNVDLDEDVEIAPEPQPMDRTPTLSISRLTFDQVASAMVSLDSVFQHSLLKVCLSRSLMPIKTEPIEEEFPEVSASFLNTSLRSEPTEEIVLPLCAIKMEPTVTFPSMDLSSDDPFVQPQELPPPSFLDPEEIAFFRDSSPLLDNIQDLESTENASITSSSAASAIASSDQSQRSHLRTRLPRSNRSPIKDFLRSNAYRKFISSESSRRVTSLPEKSSRDSLMAESVPKRLSRSNTACLKRQRLGLGVLSRTERPQTRSQSISRARHHRL